METMFRDYFAAFSGGPWNNKPEFIHVDRTTDNPEMDPPKRVELDGGSGHLADKFIYELKCRDGYNLLYFPIYDQTYVNLTCSYGCSLREDESEAWAFYEAKMKHDASKLIELPPGWKWNIEENTENYRDLVANSLKEQRVRLRYWRIRPRALP
jgi:hypothetical protein